MQQLDYLKRILRIAQMTAYDGDAIAAYIDKVQDGGPGSGNWGHKGRAGVGGEKGQRGGSAPKGKGSGGVHYRGGKAETAYHGSRKDWVNGLTGEQNKRADALVKKYSTTGSKDPTNEAGKKIMSLMKGRMTEQQNQDVAEYMQLKAESRNWDERGEKYMRQNLQPNEHQAMMALLNRGSWDKDAPMSTKQWSAFEKMSMQEINYYRSLQDKAMDGQGTDLPMPESLKRSMRGMQDYSHAWEPDDIHKKIDALKTIGGQVSPQVQEDFNSRLYSQKGFESVQAGAMQGAMKSRENAQVMTKYLLDKAKAAGYQKSYDEGEVNPYGLLSEDQAYELEQLGYKLHKQAGVSYLGESLMFAVANGDPKDAQRFLNLANKAMGGPTSNEKGEWKTKQAAPVKEAGRNITKYKENSIKAYKRNLADFKAKMADSKTTDDVKDAMNSSGIFKKGASMHMDSLKHEITKEACKAYMDVVQKYPCLIGYLGGFGATRDSSIWGHCFIGSSMVQLSSTSYADPKEAQRRRDIQVKSGYKVAGTASTDGVTAAQASTTHELGHALNNWLNTHVNRDTVKQWIEKEHPQIMPYMKGMQVQDALRTACLAQCGFDLKKYSATGSKARSFVQKQVSGYGAKKVRQCIAESFLQSMKSKTPRRFATSFAKNLQSIMQFAGVDFRGVQA